MSFKAGKFLEFMDFFADTVLKYQNEDGSFEKFKPINSQYPFYTLFYLYENTSSKHHKSEIVKKSAVDSMKYMLKSMDDFGRITFFSGIGEDLGFVNHDWSHFILLETLFDFKKLVPGSLHADLTEKILIALNEHFIESRRKFAVVIKNKTQDTHNLLMWKILLLYRAGCLLSNTKESIC